jgi:hypothetical protein
MSILFANQAGFGLRTTNLGASKIFSLAFCFKFNGLGTGDNTSARRICRIRNNSYGIDIAVLANGNLEFKTLYSGQAPTNVFNMTSGDWCYIGVTNAGGSDFTVRAWNAAGTHTLVQDAFYYSFSSGTTPTELYIGSDNWYDGGHSWDINASPANFRYVRYWNGDALSQTEFETERTSTTAVITANLNAAYNFDAADVAGHSALDQSGNAYDMALTGDSSDVGDEPSWVGAAASIAPLAAYYARMRANN